MNDCLHLAGEKVLLEEFGRRIFGHCAKMKNLRFESRSNCI
jgi:hypothetical protein